MTTTTRLDPAVLLSDLAAREDLSRGFGPRHSPAPGAVPLLGGAPSADLLPIPRPSSAPCSTPSPPGGRGCDPGSLAVKGSTPPVC